VKRLVVACALALPLLAWSQGGSKGAKPQVALKAQPGVNWASQVIRATGLGAPDVKASNPAQARLGAEMAAKLDALHNLLSHVKATAVDGTRKMADLMEKDEVRVRVEGLVKGYTIVSKRYFSDNGVEIEVEVPVSLLADVIDPDATQVLSVGKAEGEKVTGLVIDARGLNLTPALLPRVLDADGTPIYSIDSLSADARKTSGVAVYVSSLDDAAKSPKAGPKPLILKAAKAFGADLQLAPEDAKKLATLNTGFLADGKVVIVLN
jgi:hypothetical protein